MIRGVVGSIGRCKFLHIHLHVACGRDRKDRGANDFVTAAAAP
jgi:hypothetical protein